MKTHLLLTLALVATNRLAAADAPPTVGDPNTPPVIVVSFGHTVTRTATIQLGLPFLGIPIVPFPARPPFTFTVGTRLELIAPAPGATHGPVQWFKDNRPLAANGATLTIDRAAAADTGGYRATVPGADGKPVASDVAIVLIAREGQRLLNVSTRARIDAAQPVVVSGFVIEPGPASVGVLVRAVGPTLASFGVTDALAAPQLRVLDADAAGRTVAPAGPWTLPALAPLSTAETAAQRVGAFPLGARDAAQFYLLQPGAYTAHVSSADGSAGTVLIEVYEVAL